MKQYALDSYDYSDKFYPLYKQYVKLRYLTVIPVLFFIGVLFLKAVPNWFRAMAIISLFGVGFLNWLYPAFILRCPNCKGKLYPGGMPNLLIRFRDGKYCPNCGAKLLK